LGYAFANAISQLEKYLRYWAIFALLVAITVIILVKRKIERSFVD
jgi:membrane protein DedA with SNARE-associated domain